MTAPEFLTTRNATLPDMVAMLRHQRARRLDVVAPAAAIHAHEGNLVISGAVQQMSDTGVTSAAGTYRPTAVADEGISAKLGINLAYLRRLRDDRPDLWDANVNGWLHGNDLAGYPPDSRKFLVRLFQADGDSLGVARALLSRQLQGDRQSRRPDGHPRWHPAGRRGRGVRRPGPDRTPPVRAGGRAADPGLGAGAAGRVPLPVRRTRPTSPAGTGPPNGPAPPRPGRDTGTQPGAEPVLFAGFVIANSEVGEGAWSITPRIVAEICGNGLQIIADVARAVHLGSRQDEGVIRYTADTQDKELALITARARDAVATFLSPAYLQAKVTEIERTAGVPVTRPEETVRLAAKTAKFSDEVTDSILAHFIRGGQLTAGGVMQAVTSVAQTLDDADTAADLEAQALRVMELAAQR